MRYGKAILACLVLLLQSCNEAQLPDESSRMLSYDLLMDSAAIDAPIALSEFTPLPAAKPASNNLSGRLTLATDSQSNRFRIIVDELNFADLGRLGMQELPSFDFDFVQDGDYLAPIQQGPISNEHNWWEFVLLPGRVWDEAADRGFSRVALPFALKERREDCIHNGLMSFLFDDTGDISNVAFQISNQTCRYLQFEMRGKLSASYEPREVEG